MSNVAVQKPSGGGLVAIEKAINSEETKNRIIVALDLRPEDEAAQREAFKFASSVLVEVQRSKGDKYNDLTLCQPDSIVSAMIDAATFKVAIDGRKLAYLESRSNRASLQITANGFVAKVKEYYPDFNGSVTAVYKGDVCEIYGTDGDKGYKYESKNPFADVEQITGFLVYISYSNPSGKKVTDVHTVSRAEMDMIKSKGKGTAWKDFPLERMKTAALKRACKWHFRQNATLQNFIDYDHKNNFDLAESATPVRKSIVQNINQSLASEPAGESASDEVIDGEKIDDDSTINIINAIKLAAEVAVAGGHASYKEWKESLTDEQKDLVRDFHPEWWERAKEVSLKRNAEIDAAAAAESNDKPPM